MSERYSSIEEEHVSPEIRELGIQKRGAWFAGGLEMGGSLLLVPSTTSIKTQYGSRQYHNAYPYIGVTVDYPAAQDLKALFGGRHSPAVPKPDGESVTWYIKGDKVVAFAEAVEAFAPSRSHAVQTILDWKDQSAEERQASMYELRDLDRVTSVSPSDYAELVRNPRFLAGIYDFRPNRHIGNSSPPRDTLSYKSKNTALLEALHNEYGGFYSLTDFRGDIAMVHNKEFELEHDIGFWQIESVRAREFLSMAQPHLLLRDVERRDQSIAA